jgi:hypothetical protein
MPKIGFILKGVAENFSDLVARIQEIDEHTRGLIASSPSHISNTMNDIHSLSSFRTSCDPDGKLKAGNLQDRLTSQEG